MAVKYAVAKYVPDLFRQEPRNVGVFVANESEAVLRLLGEGGSGKLDLRRAGAAREDGDLYAEWFAHWQRLVARINAAGEAGAVADELLSTLGADGGDMFSVWPGGEYLVEEEDEDLGQIADELFARLVTGETLLTTNANDGDNPPPLHTEIRTIFQEAGILEDRRRRSQVRFPIREKEEVRGTLAVPYKPSFSQLNGTLTVMEDIDFAGHGEEKLQNQALSTAFMFRDILHARLSIDPVEVISIVHLSPDRNLYAQEVGMAALKEVEGIRIVNWDIPAARDRFIEERVRVANSMH